jgi:hypothetical protein
MIAAFTQPVAGCSSLAVLLFDRVEAVEFTEAGQ